MPSPTELAIIFLVGLAANAAWRYVGRGLDRFELRAGQSILQLRVAAGRQHSFVWLVLLLGPVCLGIWIWAATKGEWAAIVVAIFVFGLPGFVMGVAVREAQRRAWIPAGMEHIVSGFLLLVAGVMAAAFTLRVSPWFGFAAIGTALLALIELWMGVRMLRAKAQAHDTRGGGGWGKRRSA